MCEIQDALTEKVQSVENPLHDLRFNYGNVKGKLYTEEEDRFLVVNLEKFGYGIDDTYENIKREIKKSPIFKFDWFFKSRTTTEIARRCQSLIIVIQKESRDNKDGHKKLNNNKRPTKDIDSNKDAKKAKFN